MRLRFLDTGASGGTPGRGRSRRLESSLLVEAGTSVLIDVTRDFDRQSRGLERVGCVLVTHAHGDACGGIPRLRRWWRERADEQLSVYASEETIALRRPCRTARERRYPTFAWRLSRAGTALVYASDVARLTALLERFSRGAALLVIDGAMWGRRLFSHLTIDRELPRLCGWDVGRIVLTQIGRTAPPHERLVQDVRSICERAAPAHDGLELTLP